MVDLAPSRDCCAEPDDAASADWATGSPGIMPLAQARGLDLIDDVGAVIPFAVRSTLCSKMAKHGMAALVDGRTIAQVKPDWSPF